MIKLFFERVLFRTYWFYERVIKESDDFMKFYYAVFAFSMCIVFYAWGWLLFLGENTGYSIFQFEKIKYFSFSMILIAVIMTFSYRNKKRMLEKIKKGDAGFTNYDILVAAYITMALFWFFYNAFQIG